MADLSRGSCSGAMRMPDRSSTGLPSVASADIANDEREAREHRDRKVGNLFATSPPLAGPGRGAGSLASIVGKPLHITVMLPTRCPLASNLLLHFQLVRAVNRGHRLACQLHALGHRCGLSMLGRGVHSADSADNGEELGDCSCKPHSQRDRQRQQNSLRLSLTSGLFSGKSQSFGLSAHDGVTPAHCARKQARYIPKLDGVRRIVL